MALFFINYQELSADYIVKSAATHKVCRVSCQSARLDFE
jgi:hypothetical protein